MNDNKQRRYAVYRLGKALDRMQSATTRAEKDQAARWAAVWGVATGIAPAGI